MYWSAAITLIKWCVTNTKLLNSNSTSICGFLPLCTLHSANLCMINKKFAVRHKNKLASSSYINQTEFPWKYSITWVNWDIYGGFSLRSLELVVYYLNSQNAVIPSKHGRKSDPNPPWSKVHCRCSQGKNY